MATKPELRRAVANSYIKASDYNYNFEQLNNYIENGIADNAINNYEEDREYSKGQWVLANTSEAKGLYESNVDGNKGNSLSDTTYWGKVIISGDLSSIEEQLATKVDKFDAYKHSIPDYTNTIQVGSAPDATAFTSYTAPVDGLLNLCWGTATGGANWLRILVNGKNVASGYKTNAASFSTSFPVNAGDVVTWAKVSGSDTTVYVYGFLCPYKEGGN